MAYVYRHIRLDKNEPFYIGIGKSQNRIYSNRYRNKYWHNIVDKCGYEAEILLDNLTWEQACEKEKEFISLYGRFQFGGILCNMTDGGDGSTGVIVSQETRIKKSIASKKNAISKETREKMAAKLRGRPLPEWQRKVLSEAAKNRKRKTDWCNKPICQYDLNGNFINFFNSITQAKRELKINNISRVLSGKSKTAGNFIFKYKIHETD